MAYEDINDKAFVDVPSSQPAVRIPLQKVGISNRPHYIRIRDPFDGRERELLAQIKVTFALPADQRGLHMSRIEEALLVLSDDGPEKLEDYAAELCRRVSATQNLADCAVEFEADYELVVAKNSSGRKSSELFKICGMAKSDGAVTHRTLGVKVPFINACPCTQRWALREYYNSLKSQGRTDEDIAALLESAPRQAHTNRGVAALTIESAAVSVADLYNVLDESVPIIRELLKGTDEHNLVRDAHRQGMFCEDNIRVILDCVIKRFAGKLPPSTLISVAVEVDESVHHHNLTSEVCDTLESLGAKRIK